LQLTDNLPPHNPEAERGVLGCCLLDLSSVAVALKAGVNSRWFYDLRHAEIFSVLAAMAANGGGDCVLAALHLRHRGLLERIGGLPYLSELESFVPSAANLEYYIPDLRDSFYRRQVLDAVTRLKLLAEDPTADSTAVLSDTESVLEAIHRQADANALPDIVAAADFLAAEIAMPRELVSGVLHQGSKLILGGSSKSYKTWTLTDLAVSVASGTPWLGFPTTPGKVLYVNLEIQAGFFQTRLKSVIGARQADVASRLEIWNLRGYAADYSVLIPKIRERVKDQGHALIILDPTYKLLGNADENSATDISALLYAVESLAVSAGAAVAMAGHFGKGNASAKDTIDRISGSGVFARDPDSLVFFTKHEEEGAFTVEMILRNFPPVPPLVAKWDWPLFRRKDELDPSRLKQTAGRRPQYSAETLLECLQDSRLKTTEWKKLCIDESGLSHGKFFELLKSLEAAGKVQKSAIDGKWQQIREPSRNQNHEKDQ
jgi:hypothetical protein